ncbi:MAG: hypothetical protein O7G88_08655 [bacterium]|nr:hypothetical protein [bacterium]
MSDFVTMLPVTRFMALSGPLVVRCVTQVNSAVAKNAAVPTSMSEQKAIHFTGDGTFNTLNLSRSLHFVFGRV